MTSANLLAIDLGTTAGWMCGSPGAAVSGSTNLKEGRFESHGVRFINFRSFLAKMHTAMTINLVVFEEVRGHRGVTAAHVYGGYLAQLQTWCIDHGIHYRTRTVQEIKKFATGKANASKEEMIEAAKRLGFTPKDDNEADAICLWHLEVAGWAAEQRQASASFAADEALR